MQIAKNVELLEVPTPYGGSVYLTLTWDDSHFVLIDTGFPGQTDAIVNAIEGAGHQAANITDIILTHQDIDHIGCVKDLLKISPSARILAHADEAPYIDGRETPIKLAAMLAKYDILTDEQKQFCDRFKAGFDDRKVSITQTVTDGEIFPICGGIEVVHTPGHTPGHICVLLRESCILIGGDAINIDDGQLTGPNPQHTYDMPLGLQTYEKIKSLNPKGVVAYHGGYLSKE